MACEPFLFLRRMVSIYFVITAIGTQRGCEKMSLEIAVQVKEIQLGRRSAHGRNQNDEH